MQNWYIAIPEHHEKVRLLSWPIYVGMVCVLAVTGCFSKSVPLASLPMDHPRAAELNLKGIDRYQAGQWREAFEFFDAALQSDPDFAEAHFNAALALHQMDRHEEAAGYFRRAGELAPRSESIINSTLYRNHLGLSSLLERHLSGGYRYPLE